MSRAQREGGAGTSHLLGVGGGGALAPKLSLFAAAMRRREEQQDLPSAFVEWASHTLGYLKNTCVHKYKVIKEVTVLSR